ncbi:tRNA (mnm(5)s(2)U34)-methyltransferase [Salsuginibacillus kocurii]|uniref:tRNA (mnm(5)s(2)U34)-methyltransferase n=1 Tax=Salsuginibacillus kocurii TaxID=427078 RepID=UPI00037A628C|nr:class I SAM-dependent methyltransferase [Salsuginibacillus kocurii]
MKYYDILPFVHHLLSQLIQPGDTAIDATAGNGHDTLYLASLVGEKGRVHSFDIQEQALTNTTQKLQEHEVYSRVNLHHAGHEQLKKKIDQEEWPQVKAAIFNLGYLPGGDKSIVTTADTTITALQTLKSSLSPGSVILLVVYHGHEEGKQERDELMSYVQSLNPVDIQVAKYEFMNQTNNPPFLLIMERKG